MTLTFLTGGRKFTTNEVHASTTLPRVGEHVYFHGEKYTITEICWYLQPTRVYFTCEPTYVGNQSSNTPRSPA